MADVASAAESLKLFPRPPYRLDLTAWALRRRARNRIDEWDGSYRRTLLVGDRAIPVHIDQFGSPDQPGLRIELHDQSRCDASERDEVARQVTSLLGLDVELDGFYDVADRNTRIGALKDRFLGLRPPRFPTLFEAMVNAVANQQLSLEVGLTLLNRLVDTCGVAPTDGSGSNAFPPPEAVLAMSPQDLRALGFSACKADYLLGIADAIATGAIDEDVLQTADRDDAVGQLMSVRGIGRWSAEYVLLRGLGRLDVYPGDDVGARHKIRRLIELDHDPDYDEIAALLAPLHPWSGMLYFHLVLDDLVERGDLVL